MSKRKSSGARSGASKSKATTSAAPATTSTRDISSSNSARARERAAERRQQRQRQRQLLTLGGVMAVVLIGFFLYIISTQPADAPIPEESLTRYDGLPTSTTERGYPRIGEPLSTVRVVEYSSFGCPACAQFHEQTFPGLLERVRRGEISFTFVPIRNVGAISNIEGASRAALCANEQGQFWPYHDALFAWQSAFGNTAFSQNRLETGIRALSLDVSRYNACMQSQRVNDTLTVALAEASEVLGGSVVTPSITVDGVVYPATDPDAIHAAIDARLRARGITPGGVAPVSPPDEDADAEMDTGDEADPEVETGTTAVPTSDASVSEADAETDTETDANAD